jgi:hypothetical protein
MGEVHDRPSKLDCRPLRAALDTLENLIIDGLQHGFFQYSIACEVGNGGKRHLIISAGKSHKFTLRPDELPD